MKTIEALKQLESAQAIFGGDAGQTKLRLLDVLAKGRLSSADQVRRLHESLCFLRALPDSPEVLARVEALLAAFPRRADLRRHRGALASTGIAGTSTHYSFFQPTASWLARNWPGSLHLDWDELSETSARERLERLLPLLVLWAETPALDELPYSLRQWLKKLRGPRETDAVFLVRRFDALKLPEAARQVFFEEYDLPLRLDPGPGTPSRTEARWAPSPVVFQTQALRRERPDLWRELKRPPRSVISLNEAEGRGLLELARSAMVSRARDLDAFCNGDPRDVRMVDAGEGLQFALMGVKPEKRLLLESFYGVLTLKNGVPIGYMGSSALMNSSEIAFNQFETWRGAEAAWIYARALSMVRALFGARVFCVYSYQLGHHNDEGLQSGAWWFYQKLGYRPREPHIHAIMEAEQGAMARKAGHRTDLPTLRRLAEENMYLWRGKFREDIIGIFPLETVGERVVEFLAERYGSDRERAERELCADAAKRLGAPGWKKLPAGERLGFERWSPLVAVLPGLERWSAAERRGLFDVMRAKGGRRESDYVRLFDAHLPLRGALRQLAQPRGPRES